MLWLSSLKRLLRDTDLLERQPRLKAYQARCEARPSFQRALRDQLAAFEER